MVLGMKKSVAAVFSVLLFSGSIIFGQPVVPVSVPSAVVVPNTLQSYAWYTFLVAAGLMAYRLESKGRCEDVSYDFGALMRGTDGYKAKMDQAVAWFDRYVIGQPYKSKSVKTKNGDLIVSDAQEPLGLMGIAQSNIKPALVGIGFAAFLNKLAKREPGMFNKDNTLEALAWLLLGGWALKSA